MSFNIFFFIFTISAAKLLGPENWGLITLLSLFTFGATYLSSLFTFGVSNGMGILIRILPIALVNLFTAYRSKGGKLHSSKCVLVFGLFQYHNYRFGSNVFYN